MLDLMNYSLIMNGLKNLRLTLTYNKKVNIKKWIYIYSKFYKKIFLENVSARGERLELLVNKTENLRDSSVSFRKTSRNLARALFWKNVKLYVVIVAIILFMIYVIVSMACGGLAWQTCINKS